MNIEQFSSQSTDSLATSLPPHCQLFDNAIVIPQVDGFDFACKPMRRDNFICGVVSNDDTPKHIGHVWKDKQTINLPARTEYLKQTNVENTLKGKWLFAGILAPHFGHFLSESLHRLWAWYELKDQLDGIIVLPHPKFKSREKWPGHIEKFYSVLDIPVHKITEVTELTQVETLVVPEPGSSLRGSVNSWYQERLQNAFYIEDIEQINTPEKVYVSRTNFKSKGRVAGLDAVEQLLTQNGFSCVSPEELDIPTQLATIHNAKTIVWEEGSAAHLLELLPQQRADSYMIMRRPHQGNFTQLLNDKYHDMKFFRYVMPDNFLCKQANNALSFVNNIKELVDFFVENNIISTIPDTFETQFSQAELSDTFYYALNIKGPDIRKMSFLRAYALIQNIRRYDLAASNKETLMSMLLRRPVAAGKLVELINALKVERDAILDTERVSLASNVNAYRSMDVPYVNEEIGSLCKELTEVLSLSSKISKA